MLLFLVNILGVLEVVLHLKGYLIKKEGQNFTHESWDLAYESLYIYIINQ